MQIAFTKMHGLGNDFIVIDAYTRPVSFNVEQIRWLANRHFGVGCDQVLVVERPTQAQADFRYRIYNADGGEVEQCGNGARCFARYVRDHGLINKDEMVIETAAGLIRPRIEENGQVTVNMGMPRFAPDAIPFLAEKEAPHYKLDVNGRLVDIGVVSMGNPHTLIEVAEIHCAPVTELGPLIERHVRFPQGTNVGFMEIVAPHHLRLRVFERGTGETLACGTGACAAVTIGRLWGRLETPVNVDLPGGRLAITWQGNTSPVYMTGPAAQVFEGKVEL